MSIINDAIKKARKEFVIEKKGIAEDMPVDEMLVEKTPTVEPFKLSETKWTVTIIVSLVFIISLLGSVLLYRHLSRVNPDYSPAMLNAKSELPATMEQVYQKAVFPNVNSGKEAKLNGIVYGPTDKWAIINNRIVREGDSISDGTLILIAKDFVKVEKYNGEELILELR